MSIFSSISNAFFLAGILIWDVLLTLGNLFRSSRPVGKVTPKGHPGYGGHWPEYIPPRKGDSRSACPGLNALANHGIISRSGRGIKFIDLPNHIFATYNLSLTFAHVTSHAAARLLNRRYLKDTFDLEEINIHNGIEHDASLTRLDAALQPDQAAPHPPFLDELFTFPTGKDSNGEALFTVNDLSRISGKRRVECKATNKEYSLGLNHRIFSCVNTTMILLIFGGRVDDVQAIFSEERIPQGWESRTRKPYGLTLIRHGFTALLVEAGVRESDWTANT